MGRMGSHTNLSPPQDTTNTDMLCRFLSFSRSQDSMNNPVLNSYNIKRYILISVKCLYKLHCHTLINSSVIQSLKHTSHIISFHQISIFVVFKGHHNSTRKTSGTAFCSRVPPCAKMPATRPAKILSTSC